MEFGKLPTQEIAHVDFTLPPDPAVNAAVLGKGKGHTKFYTGCAKWGKKEWVGSLYPAGTKEKDFLPQYARQFNAIEFNGLFYGLPPRHQVEKWADMVPGSFLFCPKFTQVITHLRRLNNTRYDVDAYLDATTAFGIHLGPAFLMPHPQMSVRALPVIEQFLTDLPQDFDTFLEVRHEDWYRAPGGYNQELYQYLRSHRRGTIITDVAGRRDCAHMHLSMPECFIRFVGNALHPTDYTRIDAWVRRIKLWMDQGLERCCFFMHQHDERDSATLIKYYIQQMNLHCKANIPIPADYGAGALF